MTATTVSSHAGTHIATVLVLISKWPKPSDATSVSITSHDPALMATFEPSAPLSVNKTNRLCAVLTLIWQRLWSVSTRGRGKSFFKPRKAELIWRRTCQTHLEVAVARFEYINGLYNLRR